MPPKRKSTDGAAGSSKKARSAVDHAPAAALASAVLASPATYPIPEDDADVRALLVQLAQYAKYLEGQVDAGTNASGSGGVVSVRQKTQEELEDAAEKVRKAAQSGIKKQMKWRPSCKSNSAKWTYDGICPDPAVFGVLMGLDGPPKFKQKKFTKDEFQDLIGRYNTLYITGDHVNVRWSDTGEFKFSGTYGISY
ncbi:hypothetical protein EVJ58_g7911 [Rhodofomes roseus]|uniref:Uncharacterized protein n=1 Tax=Rhodofomes roseus TaxID=34475 RepID=A0A4Y9Y228_9APHY|nr:hypothetical protein EVJ58_g7911 [Rhodofomes roseus]